MSVEKKIDTLTDIVRATQQDVAAIKQTLGGNTSLGQKGLSEDHGDLKKAYYKTKTEVGRLKWIASLIAGGISAVIAGVTAYFKG